MKQRTFFFFSFPPLYRWPGCFSFFSIRKDGKGLFPRCPNGPRPVLLFPPQEGRRTQLVPRCRLTSPLLSQDDFFFFPRGLTNRSFTAFFFFFSFLSSLPRHEFCGFFPPPPPKKRVFFPNLSLSPFFPLGWSFPFSLFSRGNLRLSLAHLKKLIFFFFSLLPSNKSAGQRGLLPLREGVPMRGLGKMGDNPFLFSR